MGPPLYGATHIFSKHANIEPVITITVWNESEKENKEFFLSYFENIKKLIKRVIT